MAANRQSTFLTALLYPFTFLLRLVIFAAIHAGFAVHHVVCIIAFSLRRPRHSDDPSPSDLYTFSACLSKIPVHLAVVSVGECQDPNLAKFAVWAAEVGVKEFTVLDTTGIYSQDQLDLRILHEQARFKTSRQRLIEHEQNDSGFEDEQDEKALMRLTVRVITPQDGDTQLVQVANEFATHVRQRSMSLDDITDASINKAIRADGLAEPNLMIVFDTHPHHYIQLKGYPAWDIRLTEFINASAYNGLSFNLFVHAMSRYAKLQQRFGT